MNVQTLVRKNLFRKLLRTILLIVSIFIAFLMFGVLFTFDDAMKNPRGTIPNLLVVLNKINLTVALPYAYFDRVRGIEGVTDATFQNWFGGYYREPKNLVQTFSVEPESFRRIFQDRYKMTTAEWDKFVHDRTGIIISAKLAKKYDLRVGQRIPLFSNIYTNKSNGQQSWDFTVDGIFTGLGAPQAAFLSYEYFRQSATFGTDNLGMIDVTTAAPTVNDTVAHKIDGMFANSSAETTTQDEKAFFRSFIAQQGNISLIIKLVVGAAFVAILLVVGNTMYMAVRERTKEIGVLKTLGFSSRRILVMVLSESLLLSLTGAVLGLIAAVVALYMIAASQGGNRSGEFPIHPVTLVEAVLLAIGFGLVTGLAPALGAFRLKIVDALGRK